ncbi:MAG: type IV secretory system conjugative DNA transfer family protein [Candidatus Eremiobacteraeota bacterium]|nr:type IV secretory system conjugative DNA transfer family protein [Candidatus Eremiobacteraeota bacterium]
MKASTHPNLYTLPRRDRDPMAVIFPSIGIVVWLGAASCWAATEHVARTFAYQASLGKPLFEHIYSPFQFIAWAVRFDHPSRFGLATHHVFLHAYEIVLFGNGLGVFAAASMAVGRLRRLQRYSDLHGSAHWASLEEIRATGLLGRDRGVYVGAWRDPQSKRTKYLRDPSATHCLAFMPTGSGKTVGLVIPTLLSWERSAVVHDVKGEIWHRTAGWRATSTQCGGLGQRVFKFEPTATDGSSVRLNPFDRIRIGTPYEVQDIQNIVELVADEGEKPVRGDNRFWVEMAKRLLLGLSLHVKHDDDPGNDSLPGVAATLSDPRFDDLDKLFDHLRDYAHDPSHSRGWVDAKGQATATHPLVAQVATQMLAMEGRVKANIVAETQSFLTLYSDPVIAANISSSDFDLTELHDGRISLYLVVQPANKKRLRTLTRLILTQTMLALMDTHEHVTEPRFLIMLEEVAEIGALDVVATALGLGRGYGIKLYLIAQDLSQLETAWGTKSKTLVANCAIRIASAANDVATAELLSKMCGTMTVRHTIRNYSGSRLSALLPHTMTTEHDTQRPLLTPDEVMRLPGARKTETGEIVEPGNLLVFASGQPPIYGVQPLYFRDRTFTQRASIPPPEVRRA